MPRSNRSDSRSRSRSPSRRKLDSAGGSYSDNDTDYSDESFYSDDSQQKSSTKKNAAKNSNLTKKNVSKVYGRKGGKGGNAGGRNSKASKMTGGGVSTYRENENVAKRVMSARRLKINELRNQVESLSTQLREVQLENKSLRREKVLQDKALDKYEYQENDMPSIIQRHNEEVRVVKEQLRKQKEKHTKTEGKLKDNQAELSKAQRQIKKMRDIIDKKGLADRDEMSRKMSSMESELEDNRKRVSELERYTANLQKNHKHELGITRARHKEDIKKLQDLQETNAKLETTLREKEKELEVRNIYAQRVMKPPHKLNSNVNSVRSTPASQRAVPNSPGRERRLSERRRRETQSTFVVNENKASPGKIPKKHDSNSTDQKNSQHLPASTSPVSVDKKDEPKAIDWYPAFLTQSPSQTEIPKEEPKKAEVDDDDNWMADREAVKREAERRSLEEQRHREELQRRQEDEEYQRRRDKETQEAQRAREDDDQRTRQEQQRRESEERERRREFEERERREHEEKERREREEVEDRMKKAKEEAERMANDQAEQERLRQKALLLARMKEIDEGRNKSDIRSSPSHRKYSFTKPIENLHNGVPSGDELSGRVRGRRRSQDSDSDGGYKPTFTKDKSRAKPNFLSGSDSDNSPKHKPKNNVKKSNLMSNLFGGDTKSNNKNNFDNDLFGDFKPSRPNEKRRGQEPSGPGLFEINDNDSRPGSSSLLPRRSRQNPTAFHNRPTINAVDDFDDDLEEVVL